MLFTRRDIGKLALMGLPAARLLLESDSAFAGVLADKPNSKWAGVEIGMNVPYNFDTTNRMSGDECLDRCLQLGVGVVELRSQPVETFMGSPAAAGRGAGGRGAAPATMPSAPTGGGAPAVAGGTGAGASGGDGTPGAAPARRGRAPLTPEQQAAQKAAADELEKWRLSVPMSKAHDFRKKWEDAGVSIEIVKFDGIFTMSDNAVDYCFTLAKNLGARAISTEISVPDNTKRLGQFADKHKMMVGYHGHNQTAPADWEAAFATAKYNGANLDLGHFVAGNNTSPIPFMKQYHDRITHVHVKDMKMHGGPAVPFGEGDVPITEALHLIRDSKWKIPGVIEFEYKVPAGSTAMAEMAKTVDYCKKCLLS